MFDPISIAVIIGLAKGAQALKNRSNSTTAAACRWCGSPATNSTPCCNTQLCQTCRPKWVEAGGNNCVLCGKA